MPCVEMLIRSLCLIGTCNLQVINNVHGPAIRMFADDYDSIAEDIQIPCVMVSKADGMNIKKAATLCVTSHAWWC